MKTNLNDKKGILLRTVRYVPMQSIPNLKLVQWKSIRLTENRRIVKMESFMLCKLLNSYFQSKQNDKSILIGNIELTM